MGKGAMYLQKDENLWDSIETGEAGAGGGMVHRVNRPGKSREHFKSLLWVIPLVHAVYFISLFIILTHS